MSAHQRDMEYLTARLSDAKMLAKIDDQEAFLSRYALPPVEIVFGELGEIASHGIVEYRAIVNVDLFSPSSLLARKRVFQQHRHAPAVRLRWIDTPDIAHWKHPIGNSNGIFGQ